MSPLDAKTLLLINNYHYRRGGADAVYLEHDALFSGAGWNTASFSMQHPKNIDSEFAEYFVDEIEFGQDYGMLDKLRMAAKIIYSTEAREKMARLLDKVSPDVAHIHNVHHHISPSVLPLPSDCGARRRATSGAIRLPRPTSSSSVSIELRPYSSSTPSTTSSSSSSIACDSTASACVNSRRPSSTASSLRKCFR